MNNMNPFTNIHEALHQPGQRSPKGNKPLANNEFQGAMFESSGSNMQMYSSMQKLHPQQHPLESNSFYQVPAMIANRNNIIADRTGLKPRSSLYAEDSAIDLDRDFEDIEVNDNHQVHEPNHDSMLGLSARVANESIVILLNNESAIGTARPGSVYEEKPLNQGLANLERQQVHDNSQKGSSGASVSQETYIQSFNKDPPVTLEEALTLVQGDPDKYTIRSFHLISNLLSMVGFMMFLSLPFIFQVPKIECFNEDVQKYFRCTAQQACSNYLDSYQLDLDHINSSIISQFEILCATQDLSSKQIFSILSAIIIISQLITGILMDKFGRKKIIAIKAISCTILLIPLIPLGFIDSTHPNVVLFFYFGAVLAATFNFDLLLHAFESLPKENRDNIIVVFAATRIIGIAIVSLVFYFADRWVYFILIEAILLLVLTALYIKYVYDSPLQAMISTADHDYCKSIFNSIHLNNNSNIQLQTIEFYCCNQ